MSSINYVGLGPGRTHTGDWLALLEGGKAPALFAVKDKVYMNLWATAT